MKRNDNELEGEAVIRNFQLTAPSAKNYNTEQDNPSAIIAVGYKVDSERAVQFRKWARHVLKNFAIQGWAMANGDRS